MDAHVPTADGLPAAFRRSGRSNKVPAIGRAFGPSRGERRMDEPILEKARDGVRTVHLVSATRRSQHMDLPLRAAQNRPELSYGRVLFTLASSPAFGLRSAP